MRKSFTLIELPRRHRHHLQSSALFLPNFMAARERARDSQRKSDLRQIQKALELYRQDTTPVDFTIDGFFIQIRANVGIKVE